MTGPYKTFRHFVHPKGVVGRVSPLSPSDRESTNRVTAQVKLRTRPLTWKTWYRVLVGFYRQGLSGEFNLEDAYRPSYQHFSRRPREIILSVSVLYPYSTENSFVFLLMKADIQNLKSWISSTTSAGSTSN